jgi:hypothetical protein
MHTATRACSKQWHLKVAAGAACASDSLSLTLLSCLFAVVLHVVLACVHNPYAMALGFGLKTC